jgi:hypothetical protein
MKEKPVHNNPWAEKLENLPLPEAGENWQEMQAMLDKEMPVAKTSRRWMYWLLSLLLLIGVCTCPGPWRDWNAPLGDNKTDKRTHITNANDGQPPAAPSPTDAAEKSTASKPRGKTDQEPPSNEAGDSKRTVNEDHQVSKEVNKKTNPVRSDRLQGSKKQIERIPPKEAFKMVTSNKRGRQQERKTEKQDNAVQKGQEHLKTDTGNQKDKDNQLGAVAGDSTSLIVSVVDPQRKDSTRGKPSADTVTKKHTDSSLLEKRAQVPKAEKGFAAAVGLNHFFAIGAQDRSTFNSSGESGTITDYLPVPQLRYHFSHKLYVMAEAQFNAPQYTKQVMLEQFKSDTNFMGQRMERSVFVKKLFYFNLPVSVHVSPIKNLGIGAGIQYSRLRHAVGLFEEKQLTANRPDSVKSSRIAPITRRSVHLYRCRYLIWY